MMKIFWIMPSSSGESTDIFKKMDFCKRQPWGQVRCGRGRPSGKEPVRSCWCWLAHRWGATEERLWERQGVWGQDGVEVLGLRDIYEVESGSFAHGLLDLWVEWHSGRWVVRKTALEDWEAYFCCHLGNCKHGGAIGGDWKAEGFGEDIRVQFQEPRVGGVAKTVQSTHWGRGHFLLWPFLIP